jgi:Lipid A 3-O-deacylase (PagL)
MFLTGKGRSGLGSGPNSIGWHPGSHQPYLAGCRIAPLANGGIKEPNPGINFSQPSQQYWQRNF